MKKTVILHIIILLLLSTTISFGQTNSTENDVSKQKEAKSFPIEAELEDYSIFNIDVPQLLNSAKNGSYTITIDDKIYDLELEEFSVWAEDCKFYEIGDNGKVEIFPELATSFKGKVIGEDSSLVCLTISADQSWVSGFILSGDELYYVEPRKDKASAIHTTDEHFFYSSTDVPEFGKFCDIKDDGIEVIKNIKSESPERGGSTISVEVHCDYEYYTMGTGNWAQRAQIIMGSMAATFADAIGVIFTGSQMTVATTFNVPFKSNDCNALLQSYQEGRTRRHNTEPMHLYHILSGKVFDDIHGMSMCGLGRSKGYSIAQQAPQTLSFPDTDYSRFIVATHEVGHNFGASHDEAYSAVTLNPLCAFIGYTIMYYVFWGDCTLNYFSAGNIGLMEVRDEILTVSTTPVVELTTNFGNRFTRDENIYFEIDINNYSSQMVYFAALEFDQTDIDYELRIYSHNGGDSITLPSGDGPKEIIGYVFDDNNNLGQATATVILDKTPPTSISGLGSTSHSVDIASNDATIEICWDAATDATAGVRGYSYDWYMEGAIPSAPDSTVETDFNSICISSPELIDGNWYFQIRAVDSAYNLGETVVSGPYVILSATDIDDNKSDLIPDEFSLQQNYPNPFNPATEIKFTLPCASDVTLEIYNVLGKKIRTLVEEQLSPGTKKITWDGRDDSGFEMSSGLYFYRLQTNHYEASKKMLLLK